MPTSVLVLANLSDTAERAARYAAALSAPVQGRLLLLHLFHDPLLDPELVTVAAAQAYRSRAETTEALRELARRLPAPTGVLVSVKTIPEAVTEAIQHHQPQLLAMGLSAEHNALDYLLRNQALPVLRATHHPLLLVPEAAPPPQLPRRVAVAVDAEPVVLNAAARRLAPLLAAWPATYTVVHATAPGEQQAFPGQRALGQVRASGLLPSTTHLELYEESHVAPAPGVLQAVDDTQADLLVLMARPRSFLGSLFHRSVTAQVLRRCRVPVLLLPAEAPELPGWMPLLS